MRKIKVGIIGFGLSGRVFHAGLLKHHPGFEINLVSSTRPDDVHDFLPKVKVVESPDELISSKDVELVVNCAPNSFHFTLSKLALEAGKNVIVEKPFVNTAAEGTELIALAKKANRMLSVFQNRRWDADFLTVRKIIKENRLGKIKQFESHFDRWRPNVRTDRWREQSGSGSGLLYDLGAHLIDQTLQLFGEPDQIVADIETQKTGAAADDYFHLILKYGPMRAILHSSSFTDLTPRFQIYGDKANFVKYGLDPQEDQLKDELPVTASEFGVEPQEQYGNIVSPAQQTFESIKSERGNYKAYYDEVYAYISGSRETPPVVAEESLLVTKIIEQAIRSSSEGRAVTL